MPTTSPDVSLKFVGAPFADGTGKIPDCEIAATFNGLIVQVGRDGTEWPLTAGYRRVVGPAR